MGSGGRKRRGIKEEEKQRQYDEMIELRRRTKKNSKQRSRLYKFKRISARSNKDQRFFADNHGNTYYGTAYLDRAVC